MPLIITLNQMMIIGEEMNYLLSYLVIKIATALIIINKKKEYIMGLCKDLIMKRKVITQNNDKAVCPFKKSIVYWG